MAPVAGGAAVGAAAGTLGAGGYRDHPPQPPQELPSAMSPRATSPPDYSNIGGVIPIPVSSGAESLGGTTSTLASSTYEKPSFLEEGEVVAASNGAITSSPSGAKAEMPFRGPVRNNTGLSVSDLHVPGEYPRMSA